LTKGLNEAIPKMNYELEIMNRKSSKVKTQKSKLQLKIQNF